MILTTDQATTYAQRAGFSGQALAIIVAIAQAESGLNTTNYNPNDPNGGSYGILQINGAHFGEAWSGGTMDATQANDPQTAFNYAYMLSKQGTDFEPWGTFDPKNGTTPAYLQYLHGGTGTTATTAPVSTPTATTGFAGIDWGWFTDPVRPFKMLVGVLLIGVALFLLVSTNETARDIAQKAGEIALLV
jgi:hypothetical protein